MFNYKYILFISCIAFLLFSCTPSSHYLKKYNTFRNSKQDRNANNNNDYSDDISFFNNNEKDYYEEYEQNNTLGQDKSYNYTKNKKYSNYNNGNVVTNKNKTYTVRKGDNLFKISKKFNTTADEIAHLNKISNRNKIFAGMILKIPTPKKQYYNKNFRNKHIGKSNPKFSWPLKCVYSTKRDGLEGVKSIGIIITGKYNTSVFSSAPGIVKKVGHMRGFGNYIILMHENKYITIYSKLKNIKVNKGDIINKGKKIGILDGNKLHFQISYAGKPEDPFIYLSRKYRKG